MKTTARGAESAAVLDALRHTSLNVSDRQQPLLDRLFALECSLRGGTPTHAVAVELMVALREADFRISDEWDPNVPNAAVLAQSVSTAKAAAMDIRSEWIDKLSDAIDLLSRRRTKLGLDSDPILFASVIRGAGAAELQLPPQLTESARALLRRRPSVLEAAEMSEALSRHGDQVSLAKEFSSAAFAPTAIVDLASATARWWLAERWDQVRRTSISADPDALREARLIALSTSPANDIRTRAMALEVMGRSVDRLVVDTRDNVDAIQLAEALRRQTELYVLRAAVPVLVAIFASYGSGTIAAWIDRVTGVSKPTPLLLQGIFGLAVAVIAFAVVTATLEVVKLRRGITHPIVERAAEIFIPLVAGLVGISLHQG